MSAPLQTIEIDCAPGSPRPGDLIGAVVKGTLLENLPASHPDAPVLRLFGCWTWDFSGIPAEAWNTVRPILKERIETLYQEGQIRYGSW